MKAHILNLIYVLLLANVNDEKKTIQFEKCVFLGGHSLILLSFLRGNFLKIDLQRNSKFRISFSCINKKRTSTNRDFSCSLKLNTLKAGFQSECCKLHDLYFIFHRAI